ncbi:MAG TPA: DUF29 domain-containing protein [Coleofasciculaceae cyanobacterium]|jgi:hypothetical protein
MIEKTTKQEEWDVWLDKQVKYLRLHKFDQLDLDNIVEELEDLGREQRNACKSFCRQIIVHRLLIDYWHEQAQTRNHWRAEVVSFQSELQDRLTTNYRKYLTENLQLIYKQSRKIVEYKTELSDRFPENCPYTIEQIIEED